MKTKLGSVNKLKGLTYSNYEGLLKKELPELAQETAPQQYIIIVGGSLPWKQGKHPEHHLLYIGNIKDWAKWVKDNKLAVKEYSLGTCKVQLKDGVATVQLLSEKGQLFSSQSFKHLAKSFKDKKPKIFFEIVDSWKATPPKAPVSKENPKAVAIDQKFAPQVKANRQYFDQAVDGSHSTKQLDQHLKDLILQAKQWEAILKKNKQAPTAALQEFKSYLVQAQQDWKKVRPLYDDWLKKQQIIEQKGFTEERFQALQAANAKIQAI